MPPFVPTIWVPGAPPELTAAQLNRMEQGIADAQGGTVSIEPWHEVGAAGEPAPSGGWVNYGSGYPTAAFKKYPDGRVRLKGLVKNGTLGQPIFTLPVGYRPPDPAPGAQLIFATVATSAFGEIRIGPDGLVVVQAGTTTFVSLDGIEFDTGKTTWPTGPKGDPGPAAPIVTSLPAAPVDGQECYFVADAPNGVVWHLKYRAADPSGYRWQFVGGAALASDVATDEATASNALVALATAQAVTVPLFGDYEVEFGFNGYNTTGASNLQMSVGADSIQASTPGVNQALSFSKCGRQLGRAAGSALTATFATGAGSGHFRNRFIRATPVRVGAPGAV